MKIRTNKMKKGIALITGIIMIATVFAALPTGSALNVPNVSTENSYNHNMVEISSYAAPPDPYYPGQHVDWTVYFYDIDNPGPAANIDLHYVNVTVKSVTDPNGNDATPIIHWDVGADNGAYTITYHNSQPTHFSLHIDPNQANIVSGTYNVTFQVAYKYDHDNNATTKEVQAYEDEYMEFDVTDTNINVHDATPTLYAGQTFTDLNIYVSANWNNVNNLYLNLSNIPNGITFDSLSGWTSTHNLPATLGYKVDVAKDMAPGVYTVDYQVQYDNNDGEWCTETGTLEITVAFTPVIEAQLTGSNITITQGNASIPALGVTFTNTGNVDLRDITITPDFDGVLFYAATDYYDGEYHGQNPVQVTDIHIDSLAVGATATGHWYVALNPYVQAGNHRILFDWDATYFDNGATGNPTSYVNVNLGWTGANPMTPRCSLYSGEWIAGPYVMVGVVDNHPDFSASKIENENTYDDYFDLSSDNLVNVEIYSQIHNFELVQFTELRATLQVGGDTPFWNPLDHSATTVENDMTDSGDSINAGGDANMYWYVDVNPNAAPKTYLVNITLTGRNMDTTEYITTTMQAVVEVRGFGPELVVSSVTTGDITPGKVFYLNLTIQNMGDDTARDVFVAVPGTTGYNWNVIDGFVSAISSNDNNKVVSVPDGNYVNVTEHVPGYWYGAEQVQDGTLNHTQSKDTEYSGVTLQQLNINDAKDIVDLALYIEGVFNSPSPEIWLMKANNVAPGQTITLSFKMQTNVNMVEGRPYVINVVTDYTDSYGNGPSDELATQQVVIRTASAGTPYHSMQKETTSFAGLSGDNLGIAILLVLILIFIIALIALPALYGGKKKEKPAPIAEEEAPEEALPEESEEMTEEAPPETEEPAGETEPGFPLEEKEEGESSF